MSTKIYGCSDDLIEVEGDVRGEINYPNEREALIICSDCTMLAMKYGKDKKGIWTIRLIERGSLFRAIQICTDEDNEIYSDIADFKDGLQWVYLAKGHWEKVK